MEEDEAAGRLHAIPSATWIAVNVPGYVRDVPKALRMLGGTDKLASSLSSPGQPSSIEFRFHPDNVLSRPLYGDAVGSQKGLVLRISRPRGAGEEVQPKVQVVAQVASTYRFSSLADFQFLPVDPGRSMRYHAAPHSTVLPIPSENLAGEAEPSGLAESMLMVPPAFASSEAAMEPGAYSFKQYHAAAPGSKGEIVCMHLRKRDRRSNHPRSDPSCFACMPSCTCRGRDGPGSGVPRGLCPSAAGRRGCAGSGGRGGLHLCRWRSCCRCCHCRPEGAAAGDAAGAPDVDLAAAAREAAALGGGGGGNGQHRRRAGSGGRSRDGSGGGGRGGRGCDGGGGAGGRNRLRGASSSGSRKGVEGSESRALADHLHSDDAAAAGQPHLPIQVG